METIKIDKNALIEMIVENCGDFGNDFLGIYVDVDGNLDCCEKSNSGDSMLVLGFSGMGEFVDENQNYCNDENYDSAGVAKYIVDDGECLNYDGEILQDDGSEKRYKFEVLPKKA